MKLQEKLVGVTVLLADDFVLRFVSIFVMLINLCLFCFFHLTMGFHLLPSVFESACQFPTILWSVDCLVVWDLFAPSLLFSVMDLWTVPPLFALYGPLYESAT